jgi:hypothetical protein
MKQLINCGTCGYPLTPEERAGLVEGEGVMVKPAQQEIDWKDQYEKQKRRADMWIAKYEADIGPLEKAVPVTAQQEPVDIWVLTSEYNDYDQHGEYFEAVFIGKPTSEQIQKRCQVLDASHILSGGGRVNWEDRWYNLRKEKAEYGIKENT